MKLGDSCFISGKYIDQLWSEDRRELTMAAVKM